MSPLLPLTPAATQSWAISAGLRSRKNRSIHLTRVIMLHAGQTVLHSSTRGEHSKFQFNQKSFGTKNLVGHASRTPTQTLPSNHLYTRGTSKPSAKPRCTLVEGPAHRLPVRRIQVGAKNVEAPRAYCNQSPGARRQSLSSSPFHSHFIFQLLHLADPIASTARASRSKPPKPVVAKLSTFGAPVGPRPTGTLRH